MSASDLNTYECFLRKKSCTLSHLLILPCQCPLPSTLPLSFFCCILSFSSLEVQIPISASPQRAFCGTSSSSFSNRGGRKTGTTAREKKRTETQDGEREREREMRFRGELFLKCFCRNEKAPSAKRNRRRTSSNAHLATLDLFWSHISSSSSSSSSSPSRRLRPPSMWGVARQKSACACFFSNGIYFGRKICGKKKSTLFPTQNKKLSNPISASRDSLLFVRNTHLFTDGHDQNAARTSSTDRS